MLLRASRTIPKGFEDDIGLVFLASPIQKVLSFAKRFTVSQTFPQLGADQASLTLVGFGLMQDPVTGALVGAGVKREVTVPISDFSNRRLIYAYNSEKGTLIAITSTGNETCTGQGEQTRVDAFKGWIDPRIKK